MQSARTFSDIQLFTGIAILISGLKAYTCDLQSYHWQLIIYMAWLASVTHASLLSFLRNYLQNHRQQLWWRYSAMCTTIIMLTVAIAVTPEFSTYRLVIGNQATRYAKCPQTDPVDTLLTTIEFKLKPLFFLIYGYIIRTLKLFRWFDNKPRLWALKLRRKSIRMQFELGQDLFLKNIGLLLWRTLVISLFRIIHLHLDIVTSFLGEVFWLVVSFLWATQRLLALRAAFSPEEEDEWTFGQIFPLTLLAAPVAALIDHFSHSSDLPAVLETSLASEEGETSDGSGESLDPEIDEDYEASMSFRGAFLLVGLTYVHIAIFFLVRDQETLSSTLVGLVFSFTIVHPAIQAAWVIYDMLVRMLCLSNHRTNSILGVTFSVLILTIMLEINSNVFRSMPLWETGKVTVDEDVVIVLAALVIAYLAFLLSAQLISLTRLQKRFSFVIHCFAAAMGSIIVAVAAMLILRPFSMRPLIVNDISIAIGPMLAGQAFVQCVEFAIERWSWARGALIRCVVCIAFTISVGVVVTRPLNSFLDVNPELEFWFLLITFFSTCPIWVLLWILSDLIKRRSCNAATERDSCNAN